MLRSQQIGETKTDKPTAKCKDTTSYATQEIKNCNLKHTIFMEVMPKNQKSAYLPKETKER